MAKSEVDYQLKCTYSDIVFGEWEPVKRGSEIGPLLRKGEIVQVGLRVRFIECKNNTRNEFNVSAVFPDYTIHFESEDELNDYISKKLINFCLGIGGRKWQRAK